MLPMTLHSIQGAKRHLAGQTIGPFRPLRQLRTSTLWNAAAHLTPKSIHRPVRPALQPRASKLVSPKMANAATSAALVQPNYHIPNPSKRDPSVPTEFNLADTIERYLQEDQHRIWGFVIYRCTYKSDSEWKEFMKRLIYYVEGCLRFHMGLDMMEHFAPTVFEDRTVFDGARPPAIRDHFKAWAATAPQQEQGTGPGRSARYIFCIMVNDEALESVLNAPFPDELNRDAFVILINGRWQPEELDAEEWAQDTEPPEEFEPIDGCVLNDVGWMKVRCTRVQVTGTVDLRDSVWDWEDYYTRPPGMGYLE